MSVGLAHGTYDHGGMCYAACQEAFEWYTLAPSGARRDAITLEVANKLPSCALRLRTCAKWSLPVTTPSCNMKT